MARLGRAERAKAIREMAETAKISARIVREATLYAEEGFDVSKGFWKNRQKRDAEKFGRRQVSLHLPVGIVAALDVLAAGSGVSRSAIASFLLRQRLRQG